MSVNATQDVELSVDGYCTFADILGLLPHISLSGTTRPTRRQALNTVRQEFQRINALVETLGYVTPVASSNATSIAYLRYLNALGAASQIEGAQYSAANSEMSQRSEDLRDQYKMQWQSLERGKITLKGAVRQGNFIHRRDERRAEAEFHIVSSGEEDPTFTKNMDF